MVVATADVGGAVAESNETDNARTWRGPARRRDEQRAPSAFSNR